MQQRRVEWGFAVAANFCKNKAAAERRGHRQNSPARITTPPNRRQNRKGHESIRLDQEVFGTQTRSALTKAFAVSMSLRMIATMATFAGFPAARRASYFAFISGL